MYHWIVSVFLLIWEAVTSCQHQWHNSNTSDIMPKLHGKDVISIYIPLNKLRFFYFWEAVHHKDSSLYLLVSSADNFCKQFGQGSGLTKHPAWSGSKIFDTDGIHGKKKSPKMILKKKSDDEKACKITQ